MTALGLLYTCLATCVYNWHDMPQIDQNPRVGRKRPDEPYRVRTAFSLSPEVIDALKKENERTDVPMARIVERAIRSYLGLEASEPTPDQE